MSTELIAWVHQRIDEDDKLSDDVGLLILAALESDEALDGFLGTGSRPSVADLEAEETVAPVGAFLKSIRVQGFRGIGAPVQVSFQPMPGLTIVAGRNGSGKSSVFEGLEIALTGSTYRWRNRTAQWREHWRNLHQPHPAAVLLELAEEGHGATKVGVEWAEGEPEVSKFTAWVQRQGEKRDAGTDSLGWANAIDVYRPLMSYEELGGLLDAGPSALYDALATALGVERINDAIKRLDTRAKDLKTRRSELDSRRKTLSAEAGKVDDERARQAARLLKKSQPLVESLGGLVTGIEVPDAGPLRGLSSLEALAVPSIEDASAAAVRLISAVTGMAAAGEQELARGVARLSLLKQAVAMHDTFGDMACPVCATGDLDEQWAGSSRALIALRAPDLEQLELAQQELDLARRQAHSLITARPPQLDQAPVEAVAAEVAGAAEAWDQWASAPHDDLDLAGHLENKVRPLRQAVDAVRGAAASELQSRNDLWTPLAGRIAALCSDLDAWSLDKPRADALDSATKWLKENDLRLKNERLAPISDAARAAWASLRQESNVDLGALRLEGSSTRRRVNVPAAVDGQESGALAVMSQGELHALSLALFLPRATMPESPFRFLVLDDPVQAMDPAKVDGLVHLLAELARSRQVIVLSHDDRLPAAARRARVGARILEVSRGLESAVHVSAGSDPASRYLRDARALLKDGGLPEESLRLTLPGLFRFAVESCARDIVFEARLGRGDALAEVEQLWNDTRLTRDRVSLAVFDEVRPLDAWLTPGYRNLALGVSTGAMHGGLKSGTDPTTALEAVERLVGDIRDRRRQ